MEIRKRNGESVPFQQEKIFNAMKKAFDGQGREIGSRELNEILAAVLDNLAAAAPLTVERVQDEVERTLMERGHYRQQSPLHWSFLLCFRPRTTINAATPSSMQPPTVNIQVP